MIKLDSCSFIYLIKADLLPLAKKLYKNLRITDSVFHEVVLKGKQAGHPDALIAEAEINRKKIEIIKFKGRKSSQLANLGSGESDTIAEAIKEGCLVMIDDVRAKLKARKLKVSYISADIMLLEALVKNKISITEFYEMARDLNKVCNMRSDRYADLLAIAKIILRGRK